MLQPHQIWSAHALKQSRLHRLKLSHWPVFTKFDILTRFQGLGLYLFIPHALAPPIIYHNFDTSNSVTSSQPTVEYNINCTDKHKAIQGRSMTRKTNANQRLRSISVRSGYKYSKASVSKSVSKSPSSPIPARQRSLSRGYSRQTDESESKRSASRSPGKDNNRIKIMPKTVVRVLAWRGRLLHKL